VPTPAVYMPMNQNPTNDFYVTVRTSQPPETMLHSMVNVVHQVDSGLIADGEDTMTGRINNSQSAYLHRSAAGIVGAFAALALLLGTLGLYGVISYSVGQRTREIGVRMALGAQRAAVYQLVLKEACWLTILGIGGGILGSAATASLGRSMLFGVSPWDRGTMLAVVCVLAAATLLASYLPARRAASINPNEALRAE
jgi:macrolide transport system ATP-binding/permease protein